jgi:hypothetical protein
MYVETDQCDIDTNSLLKFLVSISGADPGSQVRWGALKKIAPSGGRREKFGVFRVKITILRQKILFFPILGGARAGCDPPGSAPDVYYY